MYLSRFCHTNDETHLEEKISVHIISHSFKFIRESLCDKSQMSSTNFEIELCALLLEIHGMQYVCSSTFYVVQDASKKMPTSAAMTSRVAEVGGRCVTQPGTPRSQRHSGAAATDARQISMRRVASEFSSYGVSTLSELSQCTAIVSVFVLTEKKFNNIIHAPGSHGEFIELMKTSGTKLLL